MQSFDGGMMARLIENDDVSEPFPITHELKQDSVFAPTLVNLLLV